MYIHHTPMFATSRLGAFRETLDLKSDLHGGSRPRRGFGPRRSDRLLAGNEEPPLGAHLVTARFAYAHHGVYVGSGIVVHYAAFAKYWRRGPVEEISLIRFADGHRVWVRPACPNGLPCSEIVRRARSRLGENRYRLFSNNCEHLSEWCVNGEHQSAQAEHFLACVRSLSAMRDVFMRLLKVTALRALGRGLGRPI